MGTPAAAMVPAAPVHASAAAVGAAAALCSWSTLAGGWPCWHSHPRSTLATVLSTAAVSCASRTVWDPPGKTCPAGTPSREPPSLTPSLAPSLTPSLTPLLAPSLTPSLTPLLAPSHAGRPRTPLAGPAAVTGSLGCEGGACICCGCGCGGCGACDDTRGGSDSQDWWRDGSSPDSGVIATRLQPGGCVVSGVLAGSLASAGSAGAGGG